MKYLLSTFLFLFATCFVLCQPASEEYLGWTEQQARRIGESMRATGRMGGFWDLRVRHTERSYNYKLRATWLTPEVIRAAARLRQMRSRISADQTRALISEAEAAGDTVILVEIDPREGSGVIPNEWECTLQPSAVSNDGSGAVLGLNLPHLRNLKALSGVMERDYDYDVFWVVFPLLNEKGESLFPDSISEATLSVRIYGKEGRVSWTIPASIRERIAALQASRSQQLDENEKTNPKM